MLNPSPAKMRKQFQINPLIHNISNSKDINNNNINIKGFQNIPRKGVNSPKNKNNTSKKDHLNNMLENKKDFKDKNQGKISKNVIQVLSHYGKQNVKDTLNSNHFNNSHSNINKHNNNINKNDVQKYAGAFGKNTGSPLSFQDYKNNQCQQITQKNINKLGTNQKNYENTGIKLRQGPWQVPLIKQTQYRDNTQQGQNINYQKQHKAHIYPTIFPVITHINNQNILQGCRSNMNISRSNSVSNKQNCIISYNNGNHTHSYRSTNKMYTKYSNSPTINSQNYTFKITSKPPPPTPEDSINVASKACTSPTKSSTINTNIIINRSISQDGNYKMISRTLEGQQLKQAVLLQFNINAKSKKQAIKWKQNNKGNNDGHKYVLDPSKMSSRENGNIKAYAVNSNQGILRKYNQDRVSIILNVNKNGIKASYFAIYDGHGGSNCCDFLTQNLHQYIFNSKKFPANPRGAIIQGIKLAESKFIQIVKVAHLQNNILDHSGSCVLIALFVENDCFVANVGDSRAVLSTCQGKPMYLLSRDHKPTDIGEQTRILKQGGKIYRTQMMRIKKNNLREISNGNNDNNQIKKNNQNNQCSQNQQNHEEEWRKNVENQTKNGLENQIIIGPLRVFPGKLSVTRTIGDIQAKQSQFGGIKNCISIDPQICKYSLTGKQDFIILGCDGIFEKLDSQEVIDEVWQSIKKNKNISIHQVAGVATQSIVKLCMDRKSADNLTAIIICLGSLGLKNCFDQQSKI